MTDRPVKRYDIYMPDDYVQYLGESADGDYVKYVDFSSADAARVEAERKVAELDKGRIEGNAQINRLWDRIASLESDLAAVTASSVEHAKTIDGLRAELARARERCERLEAALGDAIRRCSCPCGDCRDCEYGRSLLLPGGKG